MKNKESWKGLTIFHCSFFSYPPEEIIYRSYNERCVWEQLKSAQLQSTVNGVHEKCLRHAISFAQSTPEVKKPLTPARVARCPSRLERFDQYLSFVYDSHKVPEENDESALSPFVTKTASNLLRSGQSNKLNSVLDQTSHHRTTKKVTFSVTE